MPLDTTDAGCALSGVRIAIAHDYLTQRGGAERVVLALARAFPNAPVYTTLYDPLQTYPEFANVDVRTSWLNKSKYFRNNHRHALPVLPFASSSMFIDADMVIASSSGWAHGFRTDGGKLVYCYSPARWLYQGEKYLGANGTRAARTALSLMSPALRAWDARSAASASKYLAISSVTQQRVRRQYGRKADIVPAPIDPSFFSSCQLAAPAFAPDGGYFLLVSRLLPYKNVREVISAFSLLPHRNLLVIGSGPEKQALLELAPANVSFAQDVSDAEIRAAYQHCHGLVAASHEDFGLTPIEAAALGKPSAVLRAGGFLDTVVDGVTGVFFDEPEPALIADAVEEMATRPWRSSDLERQSDLFTEEVFAQTMRRHVAHLIGAGST